MDVLSCPFWLSSEQSNTLSSLSLLSIYHLSPLLALQHILLFTLKQQGFAKDQAARNTSIMDKHLLLVVLELLYSENETSFQS